MAAQKNIVISNPDLVEIRLRQLGLGGRQVPIDSLSTGLAARALCSQNHPRNWPGLVFWAETTRALRGLLKEHGWRKDDSDGLPTVVRGDDAMAVAVVRGDDGTGLENAVPSSQYPRGTATIERVAKNVYLPYEHLPKNFGLDTDTLEIPLWLLLHNRRGSQLFAELSFPTIINKSGYVEKWKERIILEPINFDPAKMPVFDEEPYEPEVRVRRRA